ncbi:hypothetical protein Dfri01_67860 [Dyadobacter frigoris]|nr:hypothetical protein Dfri01_67860 [Dyadobacter frigoris]
MVSRRGAFGHSERVKYKGIEALIRATDFVKAPETINALSLDNIEWRSFLKSVEGVYRNMSVAVGMLNTQDKLNFSSWEPNHKLDQDNLDIVEQTKEVLEFASAYISFMDDKRNDQLFEHMCNEHAYQFMKNKYGWASFYMASIEEDIQDEPADPDGDGPED